MKKIFSFLLVSAAVLAMAACQKEQQAVDTPENGVKEVTTQFVLNIAAAPSTKMTADAVQQNQNFRGIQDAKLYTFKTGVTSGTPYVLNTTATPDKFFDFGNFFAEDALDNTTGNNQSGTNETASKRVLQLSIPVGVDAVLFYGKAARGTSAELPSKDASIGATNPTSTKFTGKPEETVISAQKIIKDGDVLKSYDATARLMIAVINDIMGRGVSATTDATFGALPAVTWAQYGHQYEIDKFGVAGSRYPDAEGIVIGHKLEGLEEILGKSYYLFTYILPADEAAGRPNGEYRAGSSAAMKRMVMDMYRVITAANSATPTNANEANAKRVADAILTRAKVYFNADTGDSITDGNYESIETIKGKLIDDYELYNETTWTENFSGAKDLNDYPYEAFGVPEGAAQLGFHCQGETIPGKSETYAKDEFYYYHPNHPLVNPTMTEFEPRKYLYPAELWYYVNSPIRTTSSDVTYNDYPDGITPWNSSTSWTDWTFPGKVEGSTRGVAVVNSINYGVAMLKTNVIYNNVTTLYDNRYALTNHAEENQEITVTNSLLELRGVLVGGVNPRMNWQFTRKYTSEGNHEDLGDLSKFDGVIYDHTLGSNAVPTPNDTPNYTLVYDNYNSSEAADNQNGVYVALEFVNKGAAFYGRDNLIPSGGVFYLVAKLEKPSTTSLDGKWPTDHQIPPVYGVGEAVPDGKVAGESKKIPRVFIQDFVTNATFRINQNSLQKAYYSVPDLRASQMSLGLSVDLQWISGLEYVLDL